MTSTNSPPDGPTPENMVSYSEQLLNLSIKRLTALLGSQDYFDAGGGKELTEEFRSLRKALEIAYHERAQIQKLKGAETGARSSGAMFDLGAARAEIDSRLARLRAALPGGDVPGQPE